MVDLFAFKMHEDRILARTDAQANEMREAFKKLQKVMSQAIGRGTTDSEQQAFLRRALIRVVELAF
jgi:hypothetical protein